MSGFFRGLTQIKPTARGLAFVRTEAFARLLQHAAHLMLTKGHDWDYIDTQLREIAIRELLPKRNYDADEVVDFYKRHFQLIDGAWLPAVLKMKQDWQRMAENPEGFLRELGILPGSPLFSQQVASTVNSPLPKKL